MKRTIDLSDHAEDSLLELANALGASQDATLEELLESLLRLGLQVHTGTGKSDLVITHGNRRIYLELKASEPSQPVTSRPDVMGGDACVRDTRIPIWLLVEYKQAGMTDGELLQAYPSLNAADLSAAWDYFAANAEEIERQAREHAEAS